MGKLNLANYRPKDDSSTNTDQYRKGDRKDNVLLVIDEGDCLCGCHQKPVGAKAEFRMGHDARLRGKLIRAHCTGTDVTTLPSDGSIFCDRTAMEMAETLNWGKYLTVAKEREELRDSERVERANRQVLARATGPRVGDRQVIKVGRWGYTGNVIAVFSDGEEIEVEYVTSKGETKRHMITREQAEALGTGS